MSIGFVDVLEKLSPCLFWVEVVKMSRKQLQLEVPTQQVVQMRGCLVTI
jgi:hypothetical protein